MPAPRTPADRGTPEAGTDPAGLPGGRTVAAATTVVILVAVLEARQAGSVGYVTGVTLALASLVAALVTRRGDRCLPAMMPPLAFLAAILVAEELVLPSPGGDPWRAGALTVIESLGANAVWVIGATAAATVLGLLRHLADRRGTQEDPGSV